MHSDMSWVVMTQTVEDGDPGRRLEVGAPVLVVDQYLGNWSPGFEIAEVCQDGYRLRRFTDGRIFPDVFTFDSVREDRRIQPTDRQKSPGFERRQFP